MAKKLKIAVLSPAYPLRGGIAASSERLAQEFVQTGQHETRMFSFSLQYPNILFPGKTQYSDDPAPKDLVIETCVNSINPFSWFSAGRRIARFEPDVIICRYWLPFMGPSLGTILRVAQNFSKKKPKIVALVDNIIPHEKRIGDVPFSRYFANSCHAFVAMSRSVMEDLKPFAKDKKIAFAPHPIYDVYGELLDKKTARKQLKLDENAKIVLFFGFIRAYKGLDLLINAMAHPSLKDVQLLIAGESYEPWENYQKLIEGHKLQNRVHLHSDFIPTDEVNRFFSAADFVAQPYKTATQSGISQIAYHFEKPMLVTNVGGLAEIVPHGKAGYVVEPDSDEIALAIADFFEKNREQALIQGVRGEKGRFSWSALGEVLLGSVGLGA